MVKVAHCDTLAHNDTELITIVKSCKSTGLRSSHSVNCTKIISKNCPPL
jgi:hypothetical protein